MLILQKMISSAQGMQKRQILKMKDFFFFVWLDYLESKSKLQSLGAYGRSI